MKRQLAVGGSGRGLKRAGCRPVAEGIHSGEGVCAWQGLVE